MRILPTKSYNTVIDDYNNRPSHRETDLLLVVSGVQLSQTNLHFRHTVFSSQHKSKVNILTKTVALRIILNIDGSPLVSRSHTHPSHTQNSRATQCIRDVWIRQF